MDLRQYRRHARPAAAARLRVRLDARGHDLPAGVLPLGAVAVYAHVREGTRLSQECGRQLGPGGPDGAGERAGHRRSRLAVGCAGRAPRDPAVVHEDHRVRGRTARRAGPDAGLARVGQDHAAQLDRPLRGRRAVLRRARRRRAVDRIHDAARHADGRDLHGGRRRAPAGRQGRRQ